LADTESRIKDATQPRFILEIGLVKLIEMNRLASIESILERLNDLESGSVLYPDKAKAAAAPTEKKTLNTEPLPSATPQSTPPVNAPAVATRKPNAASIDIVSLVSSLPVKLPPIPSEELEHVEDTVLDDAYERKLALSGDDLAPIDGISDMVKALVANTASAEPILPAHSVPSGRNGASAAAAIALAEFKDAGEPEDLVVPALRENASQTELLAFAKSHPAVRNALKVFRGKVVRVTRT
jgi:hypothetical protein